MIKYCPKVLEFFIACTSIPFAPPTMTLHLANVGNCFIVSEYANIFLVGGHVIYWSQFDIFKPTLY